MKKINILLFFCLVFLNIQSQIKTVNVVTAGTLSTLFTTAETSSTTTLSVSGSIDARDFVFMRDNLSVLASIDLSTASIKAYTGTVGTYSGVSLSYPANELPLCAFYNANTITYKSTLASIKLPTTLKSIGGSAFYYCYGLTGTFTLPASVTSIGTYALYGCSGLSAYSVDVANTRYSSTNGILFNKKQDSLFICPSAKTGAFTIPTTVTYIGASAFDYCTGLTGSLTIPSSVKTIDSYAFYYCSGLTGGITIPATVTTIADGAFYGCSGLNGAVIIPKATINIGSYAFFECNKLTSFQVDALNPKFSSNNDALYSKNQDTLHICPGAKTGAFTVPSTVKAIGSYAFYNCSALTGSLVIPASVNLIGSYAFYGCITISAYEVNAANTKYLSNSGVLFNKAQDTLLVCPAGKTGSYTLPTSVKAIGTYAFYYCSGLTGSINIPASLNTIGDYAFYGCTNLTALNVDVANTKYASLDGVLFSHAMDSIKICPAGKTGQYVIPSTVISINYSAFDGCTNLTSIKIPSSVTTIGTYAFEYCSGLTEILIPKNVTSIGSTAFYSCTNLQKVSIVNPVPPTIDAYVFGLVNKTICQLVVPIGSLIAYQISANWKDFSLMSESNFTAVVNQKSDAVKVYGGNQNIIVEGLAAGEKLMIYSTNGKQLYSSISEGNKISIPAEKGQCYLLKTSGKIVKVIL